MHEAELLMPKESEECKWTYSKWKNNVIPSQIEIYTEKTLSVSYILQNKGSKYVFKCRSCWYFLFAENEIIWRLFDWKAYCFHLQLTALPVFPFCLKFIDLQALFFFIIWHLMQKVFLKYHQLLFKSLMFQRTFFYLVDWFVCLCLQKERGY